MGARVEDEEKGVGGVGSRERMMFVTLLAVADLMMDSARGLACSTLEAKSFSEPESRRKMSVQPFDFFVRKGGGAERSRAGVWTGVLVSSDFVAELISRARDWEAEASWSSESFCTLANVAVVGVVEVLRRPFPRGARFLRFPLDVVRVLCSSSSSLLLSRKEACAVSVAMGGGMLARCDLAR